MPKIHKSSFIAPNAVIIGNVTIGENCGVFPNAVIRGDENSIVIGDGSNIQDCCIIHTDAEHQVKIGKNVTIGHAAMIHGATILDDCLIGIHATVLNGARISSGSIIGACALVYTLSHFELITSFTGFVKDRNKEHRSRRCLLTPTL